jgi:hypothetical protein
MGWFRGRCRYDHYDDMKRERAALSHAERAIGAGSLAGVEEEEEKSSIGTIEDPQIMMLYAP